MEGLLQSVLDRSPEERDDFLREACAGDEALEREVRSLAAPQQEAGSFLESPAIDMAAHAFARANDGAQSSRIIETVSHYRICHASSPSSFCRISSREPSQLVSSQPFRCCGGLWSWTQSSPWCKRT